MKRAFLSLLLLFFVAFLSNSSYAQIDLNWKWMHPKPQGNTLRYVKMFSATNIVAVGYAGAFISTTNGGTSWTIYENAGGEQAWGLGRSLYSGWFFNMTTGLVCGSSGWIARTTTGGASWDTIPSGSTGTLYGMHFINANTGFIGGTSGTVLKSTNAGLTWTAIPTGGTLSIYNIYAADENHIYAPTSSSGNMLFTTNGGANWTTVATGGTTLYDANFININTGFVLGSSGHIKKTVNGGLNWTSVNPTSTSTFYDLQSVVGGLVPSTPYSEGFENVSFPPTGWRAVNISGTVVWVRSTLQYHSGSASAFINYDCGAFGTDWLITPQWSIMSGDSLIFWLRTYDNGYVPDSLAVRVSTTDTALASFTTRILYCAEGVNYPAANTWKRFSVSLNPFAGQNIYIGFKHADDCGDGIFLDDISVNRLSQSVELYATGDAFYIYRSTNLGASWDTINHLHPSQIWTSTWYSMDKNGTNLAAVGASGLINMSTNNGVNWTNYNTWIFAGTFYDVWAEYNDKKVIAVGSGSDDTKGLISNNGGATWSSISIPTSKYFRSISMVNTNTGFIAGSSGAMFRTTNGGTSWDSLPFPSTNLVYKVDFVNASTGWAVSSSSPYIWKTTDGGATWNTQTGPASAVYSIQMLDANTGWLVGTSGQLRKTTDGGATWNAQTPGTTSTLYAVKMLNVNSGYIAGSSSAIAKTTNGGTNWTTITHPYSTTLYGMDWWDMNHGMVAGSSTGYTAKTDDAGANWSIETTSGSTMYSVYMRSHDSAWACGSIQGIYKWSKGLVSVANWNNQIPTTYFLSQNYPNPFNPATTIKFGIPKAGSVSLNVYDITGRLVRTLINNAPLNAGTVTYNLDGTNLASGVYFYTLIVDNNKIDTKKMILVK